MTTASSTEKRPHGGKRPGAGRKKSGRKVGGPHRTRPSLSAKHPVHVSLRCLRGVPRLRQACMYQAIRVTLVRYLGRLDFRIVHISIQHNHLHLIVEAADKRALRRGMQSFAIVAARAINAAWGRSGKVFQFRYDAKQVKTDRYARNVLSYVLNNWRRHREDFFDGASRTAVLDEYSSAVSFDGWAGKQRRFKPPPGYEPLPVAPPQTALLISNWQWWGLIDPFERPGPLY